MRKKTGRYPKMLCFCAKRIVFLMLFLTVNIVYLAQDQKWNCTEKAASQTLSRSRDTRRSSIPSRHRCRALDRLGQGCLRNSAEHLAAAASVSASGKGHREGGCAVYISFPGRRKSTTETDRQKQTESKETGPIPFCRGRIAAAKSVPAA